MKRLLFLLTALCLSMSAFAGNQVFAPNCKPSAFRVGIDALYLRPTNSDLFYVAKMSPIPMIVPVDPDFEANLAVEPDYHWGFYAYIGYAFPCTANDLTVAYTYLYSNDSAFVAGDSESSTQDFAFVTPPTMVGGFAALFSRGSKEGKSKINLNAVDLEGGQRFKTCNYDLRMFAGLRYASVNYNLNTVIHQESFAEIPPSDQEFNSYFKGLGPRVGVNGHYFLGSSSFGINANISAGVLIGNLNSYFASNVNINVPPINRFFEAKDDSQIRMVPVLEGKLGLDYSFPIGKDCNPSALIFEAGYQATNYFNVVDHSRVTATEVSGTAISYMNSQISTSDIGFNGIYVGLKYYA